MNEYKYSHMLIDTKNCLYRAIYAGLSDPKFMESKYDFLVIFFRFISSYIMRFKPKSVHLFWDAPKETLWRRKIYPQYKDKREHRIPEVEGYLNHCSDACKRMIPYLNCRDYDQEMQEADDLIYAFCRLKCHNKIVIISSDGDFKQIPYMFRNIILYNPLAKDKTIYEGNEEFDPVDIRCLMGEKSDNVDGYDRIGPVRAVQLASDHKKRKEFFESCGPDIYMMNRQLIDLSICPHIYTNMLYILKRLGEKPNFNLKEIYSIIQTDKIRGLLGEVSKTILSFKSLEKEEV